MKTKICLCLVFIYCFCCSAVFAEGLAPKSLLNPFTGEGAVVTSRYISDEEGGRLHPVLGYVRPHHGIDIANGSAAGTPIVAAADGVCVFADWASGYGNYIVLDHGGGYETCYAHNEAYRVSVGDKVKRGDVIALCGDTGLASGPHCHFEVRINGGPVDPLPFLSGEAIFGVDDPGGTLSQKIQSVFAFDLQADFLNPLREVIEKFLSVFTDAMKNIRGVITDLFMAIITIDLILAVCLWLIDGESEGDALFSFLIKKFLLYFTLMYFITDWGATITNFMKSFAVSCAALMAGKTEAEAMAGIADPLDIAQHGAALIAPLFTAINSYGGWLDFLSKLAFTGLIFICIVVIFGSLLFVALEIVMSYLEFYAICLFGFTAFIFAGFQYTRKYAANALSGIMSATVKLMFFCFFSLVMQSVIMNVSFDNDPVTVSSETSTATKTDFGSIDEFMAAIAQTETGGSSDPYNQPSGDGYGYGKYQISYSNWDAWCIEAGINPPPSMPWPADAQEKVARYKMQQYYEQYGNWHDAAVMWNVGNLGSITAKTKGEAYWAKVTNQSTVTSPVKAVNLATILQVTLICLMFVFLGDRLSNLVVKTYCGPGIKIGAGG